MQLPNFDLFDPSEEHRLLRETLRNFVTEQVEPQALEYDRQEKFNLELFKKLGPLGLLGITAPEEYGGSNMDALAVVIAHEELSASDPGFCLAYLAQALLCINNISVNCSNDQKKKFLPKLCSGEWIGAMGMSEPAVGTDVLGMRTSAEQRGDKFIINGRKLWITNGCVDDKGTPCDVLWLYARTGGSEHRARVTTFLVEKICKGFKVGQKIRDKTGMRASNTAELLFDNAEIPRANLVGDEGASIHHMMRNLEIERLGLAAMSLGIARRCLEIMVRYSCDRYAFGKSINSFGQIQRHIAESYAEFQAVRSYVYDVARRMNIKKGGFRLESDAVKLAATPMAKNVADRAIQVLGGYGYVGEYVVERLWRDSKLLEIGGGTLEAHQKNISADLAKRSEQGTSKIW